MLRFSQPSVVHNLPQFTMLRYSQCTNELPADMALNNKHSSTHNDNYTLSLKYSTHISLQRFDVTTDKSKKTAQRPTVITFRPSRRVQPAHAPPVCGAAKSRCITITLHAPYTYRCGHALAQQLLPVGTFRDASYARSKRVMVVIQALSLRP